MFDIGWQELLVIGIVALVVIGPKDMPLAIRAMSRWASKARALAREFQQGIDEVVRESELQDIKKNIEDVQSLDLKNEIAKTMDPTGDIAKNLDLGDVEKTLDTTARALTYDPAPAASTPEAPAVVPEAPVPTAPALEAPGTMPPEKPVGTG